MCAPVSGATSNRYASLAAPGYGLWNVCAARLRMTVHGALARGTSHSEYSPCFTSRPSSSTGWSKTMRVAESAPGCHTLSHGTSCPNNARPRATGRPYSTAIVVCATCWVTLPRWLNGYPCACAGEAAATSARRTGSASERQVARRVGRQIMVCIPFRMPSVMSCFRPSFGAHLLHLHVPDPHFAAEIVLLEGEVALREGVLLVDEVDSDLAVHLDDDVVAVGDDFLGEPGVRWHELLHHVLEVVQASGALRIGVAAVHLRLVAIRKAVAECRAEVLAAVAFVLDLDVGAIGEVLVVAARTEDVAHATFAMEHAVLERPPAVAQRITGDDPLHGGGLLHLRPGVLGRDLPVLEGPGVENGHPTVPALHCVLRLVRGLSRCRRRRGDETCRQHPHVLRPHRDSSLRMSRQV